MEGKISSIKLKKYGIPLIKTGMALLIACKCNDFYLFHRYSLRWHIGRLIQRLSVLHNVSYLNLYSEVKKYTPWNENNFVIVLCRNLKLF